MAEWDITEPESPMLLGHSTLFAWNEKQFHLGERSSIGEVQRMVGYLEDILFEVPGGAVIGIDWSPFSAFWGSRRLQNVQLAFFMGMTTAMLLRVRVPPVMITPAQLRKAFSLTPSAKKEDVLAKFNETANTLELALPLTEDERDALVLAYVAGIFFLREEREDDSV